MIIVAPTGVAAINASGVTIHSFFQLPFGPYIPSAEGNAPTKQGFQHKFSKDKINIIRSMDLLVIDEVSMVRADLLDAISDVLRRYKNPNKPFGGVQLLLIGDLQQLAPVAKDEEWNLLKEHYPSAFFFDSKALAESNFLCIELTKVYRQDDSTFIGLLNNIRENRFDDATLQALNKRYLPDFRPDDKAGYITLTTHNYLAQQLNSRKLQELPGRLYTFPASVKDDFPAYSYPTDERLELKTGAQVMFVKNDTSADKRYYNGKIGKVVFISPDKIVVSDEFGNDITVEKETWDNVKYTIHPQTQEITEAIAGSFTQYPLKTAWAITIHKSQGLTFEHAVIDASAAFSHGQVYVALSRCKTLEGLVLSTPITRNAMIRDDRIQSFTDDIVHRKPGEEQLLQAQQQYFTELIVELFDFARIQQRLQYAAYMVFNHLQKLYPELSNRYGTARDNFRSDLTEVGERFQQQLQRMIGESTDYEQDPHIQERVKKGATYFLRQLEANYLPLLKASQVGIDNKEAKKAVNKAVGNLADELQTKLLTLKASREGFSIIRYLSAKAKASIEEPAASQKRSLSKAQPADTVDVTDVKHPSLYEALRAWRNKHAAEQEMPVYVILQQKAMIGLSNTLPSDSKQLLDIPGIGKKVADRYGKELLDIIDRYRKKH